MEKITELNKLKAAIRRHFRGGMATNFTLSEAEIFCELKSGGLFIEESPDCLYILRERDGHRILNYYVNSLPLPPVPDGLTVCEITARGRENLRRDIISAFEDAGFTPLFERVRLVRQAGRAEPNGGGAYELSAAGESDIAGVSSLFASCFDRLTGCISSESVLAGRIAAGSVFIAKRDGSVAGAVETAADKGFTEIRHLAVRENDRGRGLGGELVRYYLNETGGRKSFVWTEPGKPAAYKTYVNCGYTEDGNVSLVLMKGRKT